MPGTGFHTGYRSRSRSAAQRSSPVSCPQSWPGSSFRFAPQRGQRPAQSGRQSIWAGNPSTRASRTQRSRSSWSRSSRYSLVSSASAPGSGSRAVVLGRAHLDPRRGGIQAAEARPHDHRVEGQLEVQPVGARLQLEHALAGRRLDVVALSAQHHRVERELDRDATGVARLQAEQAQVQHRHREPYWWLRSNPAVAGPVESSDRAASCSRPRCTAARNLVRLFSMFSRIESA